MWVSDRKGAREDLDAALPEDWKVDWRGNVPRLYSRRSFLAG